MDARSTFAAVMDEAGRLGLAWWERIAVILAAALLLVMGKQAREVLRRVKVEPWDVVGGDVNVPTGEPTDYSGGEPPRPDDGTGSGGG